MHEVTNAPCFEKSTAPLIHGCIVTVLYTPSIDENKRSLLPVLYCRSVTLFAGASVVYSEAVVIVVTSLALLVVSVVTATDHGCSSASLDMSERDGEDVTSLLLLVFSSSDPAAAVRTHIPLIQKLE